MSRVRKSIVAGFVALTMAGAGAVTATAAPSQTQTKPVASQATAQGDATTASQAAAGDTAKKQRRLGRITEWNKSKKYGYITFKAPNGRYEKAFTYFDWSRHPYNLRRGDTVSFVHVPLRGQDRAMDVRLVSGR
ncbi:hypothetical protein [Streptomyces sp. NPDC002054]|uniref:hypothetical protein n=1 Tax=Streptomyces sp. NPDC002054 TaxID=3154663 RepID=UPI00332C1517